MHWRRYIPLAILAVVVVVVQAVTQVAGTTYYLTQLTMAAYHAVVVVGLCLVMGYAGQISLGHAGFFAIGGYGAAVLTTADFGGLATTGVGSLLTRLHLLTATQDLYGAGVVRLCPWAACIAAVLVTVAVAFVVGMPVLRLRGHYLAMATLGCGSIVAAVVKASRLFGEADGISGVPPFPLAPGVQISSRLGPAARVENYYIAWGLVLVSLWLLVNLINSRVGRALRAIHGGEGAANAMGVNTSRYKLYAFVLSAALAAVAGVFLTHYSGGIAPSDAGIMNSVRYVAIVAVGGMANLWGALIMAVLLNFMSLRGWFGTYDDAVFGSILIVIMLFAPNGLITRATWLRLRQLLRLRGNADDKPAAEAP